MDPFTIRHTATGKIVGQVTLAPLNDWWQDISNAYEIAVEVSSGSRSAEGTGSGGPGTTALCRGSGPRIRGMQKRVPKNPFYPFCHRRWPVQEPGRLGPG